MPVKRRVPKRRIAQLPDACFRHLADLLDPGEPWPDEVVGMIYFDDPTDEETAWQRHGAAAIDAHQAVHGPNSMPALWFRYGLPGDNGGEAA
jgi:hypothetical protein